MMWQIWEYRTTHSFELCTVPYWIFFITCALYLSCTCSVPYVASKILKNVSSFRNFYFILLYFPVQTQLACTIPYKQLERIIIQKIESLLLSTISQGIGTSTIPVPVPTYVIIHCDCKSFLKRGFNIFTKERVPYDKTVKYWSYQYDSSTGYGYRYWYSCTANVTISNFY